ncbi:MAG: tRNA (N(6)-L-threonylcarbamoyladenosine(37)-C(2))-methylthiotransferase MtaB [Clostridia bacterium]|nr:tRNA (N(6)-L-threonylcarbamoyladenosine(37)-C(2))-methylthiotransferase MtaB [Clostridia bacterium]
MKNFIKTAAIYTLGCRVNQYESDAIANELTLRGWDIRKPSEICSVYIINTCTVTAESDRKSRQIIRRLKNQNPEAFVAVCGCYSQVRPEEVGEYADFVCGTRNKAAVITAAEDFAAGRRVEKIAVSDPSISPYEPLYAPHTDRTRAFVKIEDGCDGKCAYCLIRVARGNVVSRREEDILSELAKLYDAGYPEAVLTGIETSAYGRDTGADLLSLLLKTNDMKTPGRLRLGSVDPAWLKPDTSAALSKVGKFMPHIHLSVQSGSSAVLAAMRRRYNAETLYKNVEACRKYIPGVRFSADIIVGFPGETEEDFNKTKEFLRFANLIHAHIFPFSAREGTEAAAMKDQIPPDVKSRRAAELAKLQREINEKDAVSRIGDTVSVLFETYDGEYAYGHSDDFSSVKVKCAAALHGKVLPVTLTGFENEEFEAKTE